VPDPYDVLTIAAVVDELAVTIGNGRIQRIGLIDPRSVGAEVYAGRQRHYFIASADDRHPRLRLATEMPSLDPALVTPFGLLLRKHARGGVIVGIDQPPLERLVRLSIARRQAPLPAHDDAPDLDDAGDSEDDADEAPALQFVTLSIELMGRHSNLILVDDDGRVMESAKRVPPTMSRVRPVLPRLPYALPPLPDRLDPRDMTPASAAAFLARLDPDAELARSLVAAYRGLSPLMAREIAFQLTGDATTHVRDVGSDGAAALVHATHALLAPLQSNRWNPRVYRESGDSPDGEVVAFSPMPMAHLAAVFTEAPVSSVSQGLALAESAAERPAPGRHAQRRQRLLAAIEASRAKAERKLAALRAESARALDAERFKSAGELIYAYLWQIAPGQTTLQVDGQSIDLDPALSAKGNAQVYFERYRKAQSAASHLPQLAAQSQTELAYLDQLATLVAQAPGFGELEALAAEWADAQAHGDSAQPKRKSRPSRPRALLDAEGNSVYVGRSGPQNDLVTFDIAGPDDTWLHARGVPGSHVVIRWRVPGSAERPETIAAAAALAAWYSAARESRGVEVDIAPRRHVRKIKGGGPGMVTYRNERTIRVPPAPEARVRDVLSER
jgi:predicted ribosome quality control (RQC) complex YloA/Tae2 family protein